MRHRMGGKGVDGTEREREEEPAMLGNDCTPFSKPGACVGGREQTEMRQKR